MHNNDQKPYLVTLQVCYEAQRIIFADNPDEACEGIENLWEDGRLKFPDRYSFLQTDTKELETMRAVDETMHQNRIPSPMYVAELDENFENCTAREIIDGKLVPESY